MANMGQWHPAQADEDKFRYVKENRHFCEQWRDKNEKNFHAYLFMGISDYSMSFTFHPPSEFPMGIYSRPVSLCCTPGDFKQRMEMAYRDTYDLAAYAYENYGQTLPASSDAFKGP